LKSRAGSIPAASTRVSLEWLQSAPKIALALGYDVEDALERLDP
jgi:hypothetical protein